MLRYKERERERDSGMVCLSSRATTHWVTLSMSAELQHLVHSTVLWKLYSTDINIPSYHLVQPQGSTNLIIDAALFFIEAAQ